MSLNSASISASSQLHHSRCAVVVDSSSRFHRLGFSFARSRVLLHGRQTCPIHYKATGPNPPLLTSSFCCFRNSKQQHPPPHRSRTIFNSQQHAVVDYRGAGGVSEGDDEDTRRRRGRSRSSTSTMEKIVEKLKKFGYVDDDGDAGEEVPTMGNKEGSSSSSSLENIFYEDEGGRALQDSSRGGILTDPTEEEVRFPWETGDDEGRIGGDATVGRTPRKKKSHSFLAETTLPERELRRLRLLAIKTKSKTKIGSAGVTKEIVDKIHDKWKTEEVVRLKCEGPPALNMKRMHEILERKTGGTVIWRSGSSISLYRGVTYEPQKPVKHHLSGVESSNNDGAKSMVYYSQNGSREQPITHLEDDMPTKKEDVSSFSDTGYEHEMDKLLESLGPRFTDWPGPNPLPVDADLLPGSVPGYSPPFRILPYGVRRSLSVRDQTTLRRIARVLPPHFAIGRSRQLQGLAASIVKLWEKSSIAKITLKRRVQLTSSERLAEELKKLTGGTLLCRNKDYIVFYRGKDFLSLEMTEALLEREQLVKSLQDEEEHARLRASSPLSIEEKPAIAGTLSESLEADAKWGKQLDGNVPDTLVRAAEVERHAALVKKLERKLSAAERRLFKAEKALGKVEAFLKPAEIRPDPDSITDEERFMFRKLGLRMKAFLLLGRRGVFDGTVENMHLHWKYRELVKIIVKAKTFGQVKKVALSLEAESGGVLVSVDKVSKGFAVIVYRGKGYKLPSSLRPKNLLTKRKALARSIEMQRRESVRRHISNLRRRTKALKSELDQMKAVEEHGDVELYERLDSSYLSDDEESEDEGDEAYLETFDCGIGIPKDGSNNDHDQIDSEVDENNYNFSEVGEGLDSQQKDLNPSLGTAGF